jgi:hypothetical protein
MAVSPIWALVLTSLLACTGLSSAYYVPGTYPTEFWQGDTLQGEPAGG